MTPLVNAPPAITIEEAAVRLGVEPRSVREYLHEHLLRFANHEMGTVHEADVTRLQRVLRRCASESR